MKTQGDHEEKREKLGRGGEDGARKVYSHGGRHQLLLKEAEDHPRPNEAAGADEQVEAVGTRAKGHCTLGPLHGLVNKVGYQLSPRPPHPGTQWGVSH